MKLYFDASDELHRNLKIIAAVNGERLGKLVTRTVVPALQAVIDSQDFEIVPKPPVTDKLDEIHGLNGDRTEVPSDA